MAEDLQAQIDELKDRISIFEQLLVLGSFIISDISSSRLDETCKDYTDIVELHLSPKKQTKMLRVSVETHPHLYSYMKGKKGRGSRIIDL